MTVYAPCLGVNNIIYMHMKQSLCEMLIIQRYAKLYVDIVATCLPI